jgi:(p)ppGpp synthase/HD superfamily hydrolase
MTKRNGLSLIEKAAALAARGHKEQVRKHGNVPYVVHPFMVARILTKHGFGEVVVASGLAHDLLEDTDIGEEEILEHLGEEVLSIVKNLSEDKSLVWEERKAGYVELVRVGSFDVKAVSCADKIHNMGNMLHAYEEMGSDLWDRFSVPREKRLWFEKLVLQMFDESGFKHDMVEEYRILVKLFEETD